MLSSADDVEAGIRWRSLEKRIENTDLTNSWQWVKTWLDNYHSVVSVTFAIGVVGHTDVGAALITESVHSIRGIPVRAVHLGTAGEPARERTSVEYNRLLVASETLDLFAVELILTLKRRFRWSALRLNGFVPAHGEALMRACALAGLRSRVEQKTCSAFDFDRASAEGYRDVISALGKNTRHSIRRSQRLFRDRFGPLRLEWAETIEQAELILRELITLHEDRWRGRGEAGAFPTQRVRRYHQQLITALSLWPQGSLIVVRLSYGDTTIGCLYNFVENGHVMFYKGGIAQFVDNRLKPGLVTHALCMAECQRRGLTVKAHPPSAVPGAAARRSRLVRYDFLAGEGRYKEQLSNAVSLLIWVLAWRGARMGMLERLRPPFQWSKGGLRMLRHWRRAIGGRGAGVSSRKSGRSPGGEPK